MRLKLGWLAILGVAPLIFPSAYAAGSFGEISLMGSYSKTSYGTNSSGSETYSISRHYTATMGVNITPVTEIELSYSNSKSFFNNDPLQTIEEDEQNLGLSIIQGLLPREWVFQPYVKVGAAQYNRKQTGTTSGIPDRAIETKSPSGILGGGVRLYLLKNFSLKGEAVTYLPDMHMAEAKNNLSAQVGFGWEF